MKTAVLLLAHGTPENVCEIPEYLRNVTAGRPIPDSVVLEVAHRYGSIGHSPLTDITLRQAQKLSAVLSMPVYVGMRNWKPYIRDSGWVLAFHGHGMAGGPWLGPTVEETLRQLKQEGYARALIQPVGFVCDHVEVLYDIDIGFRDYAAQIGMETSRTESLNDSPTFIAALADLVRKRLQRHASAPH